MNTPIPVFLMLIALLLGWGCKREQPLEKVDHIDFLKFYHVADEAVEMVESDAGYAILANGTKSNGFSYLQLIMVDHGGHLLWQKTLEEDSMSWAGHDLICTEDGGYAVAGDWYDSWGDGNSLLIAFRANGDTIWTQEKPGYDTISDPIFLDIDTVARNSNGKSVLQLANTGLAILSHESSSTNENDYLIDFYSYSGDSLFPSIRLSQNEYVLGGFNSMAHSEDGKLTLFGEFNFYSDGGPNVLSVFSIADPSNWNPDASGQSTFLFRPLEGELKNRHASVKVVDNGGHFFFLGTMISYFDNKSHFYIVKADAQLKVVWEYVEGEGQSQTETIGLGLAPWGDEGILVVGEELGGGASKLFVLELDGKESRLEINYHTYSDTSGVDTLHESINYPGNEVRRFTFGSDLDPESAKAVLVTQEGKWLILGDNSFQGKPGIWLMQIDPEKLD